MLDEKLKKLAGSPSKTVQLLASRITKMIRKLVNTRAFESLVVGLLNKRSRLHPHLKKHHKIQII